MNSKKIKLSPFSETYMLLMDYPSIRREEIPDQAKNSVLNLLHQYIDAHNQRLFDELPGDGVQYISRFQYQCANMIIVDKIRYIIMFQQVVHKRRESEINYIKRLHNDKSLATSVRNSYTEYQLMHTFLESIQYGGK